MKLNFWIVVVVVVASLRLSTLPQTSWLLVWAAALFPRCCCFSSFSTQSFSQVYLKFASAKRFRRGLFNQRTPALFSVLFLLL